jgi:tRNA dimethylallyltransferase
VKPLLIFGPTACGKTAKAIEIAGNLASEEKSSIAAEIISADSMLVYRGMDIGTAKPTKEEQNGVPHHLIDIRNPDEEWTVGDFVASVEKLVPEIQARGRTPIIVGGTGLYFWCLTRGFSLPTNTPDLELRKQLNVLAEKDLPALYAELEKVDPAAAKKIHANDSKRIVRALEVYKNTGTPISELQKERKPVLKEYELLKMDLPRTVLYERINRRVDSMIKKGLVAEVRALRAKGYTKKQNSMLALGYKETFDYLDGKYGDPDEDASLNKFSEELKKVTRNFARRQGNWLKRL